MATLAFERLQQIHLAAHLLTGERLWIFKRFSTRGDSQFIYFLPVFLHVEGKQQTRFLILQMASYF